MLVRGNDTLGQPKVSVIIPTKDRISKLGRCLDSVFASDYHNLEVVVVDDASVDPVKEKLGARFPQVRFLRNEKRMMLAATRNIGASNSAGEYLFFLDDDNVLARDAIGLLVETLSKSDKVMVASPLTFYLAKPHVVWTSYITKTKFPGFYSLHTDVPEVETRTFSFHNAFMVKKAVFVALGGFDAVNFPVRYGEVDFAHKLNQAGHLAVVNPKAHDWHDLGWSRVHIDSARAFYTERNRIIVIKRYYRKKDLRFYEICILPLVGPYQLVHHALSTTDSRLDTIASFLHGVISGLTYKASQ